MSGDTPDAEMGDWLQAQILLRFRTCLLVCASSVLAAIETDLYFMVTSPWTNSASIEPRTNSVL